MKKIFILVAVAALSLSAGAKSQKAPKTIAPIDEFVSTLMSKMTIEEKIGQLNLPVTGDIVTGQAKSSDIAAKIKRGEVGGLFNLKGVDKIKEVQKMAVENSRLHIPLLFGMDVIHGYETVFPIPLALSCSWDMPGIEKSARIAATEASADGICWTFSPMVDICHDARWGRIAEGSGEDPFLGAEIAKAMVIGYQGKNMSGKDEIMACVKHFALYGAGEAGRDYNTVDMSHNRMYNEYFLPYKAGVEAGAGSIMASFNEIDGVPATGNKWLLTNVLRDQWKFNGFVVTDFTGIMEMTHHGVGNLQQVSAQSLQAGTDMDMVSDGFLGTLQKSLKEGKVTEEDINKACRRILEAKYKLGLFADPYKYCDLKRPAKEVYTDANRAEARKMATKSFVLLKNEGNVLPLAKKGTIAVVGPLANSASNMPGTWSVAANFSRYSTLVEGLKKSVGEKANILYAKGSNLMNDSIYEKNATMFGRTLNRDNSSAESMIEEALAVANKADVIVAAVGESSEMSGESSCRTNLEMPDAQRTLLEALVKTGKPVVVVLFSGRPVILNWENANVPAILNVWFGGSEAADAIGDVIFGDVNPSGKLSTSFPQSVGQLPYSYSHKNTGRPIADTSKFQKFTSNYLDVTNNPLYPFGYGLSYTTFEYSDIALSSKQLDQNGTITATVTLTNSGKYDGTEVVQLYIRDLVGSITRPTKELKGFQRISLKAGESTQVSFSITPELLKFYNYENKFVNEIGDFEVMIGGNSRDVKVNNFELK
ncbi:MAG: beta-glucosidase BglX [Muribaculaceae bacterium]